MSEEEFQKEQVNKEDGRYLIYYSWKKKSTTRKGAIGEEKCQN